MIKTENFEKLEISSPAQLRLWLVTHHTQNKSVWLVTFKKSEADKYVSRWEVLDELICFGWIDGIRRKLDDKRTMQLIAPRRAEHWATTYKERAAQLIVEGRMHPSGERCIEASKASGLWNFMDEVDQLILPEDLHKTLDQTAGALGFFEALNNSSKRFALRWLKLAKTEKTRKKRIMQLTALSSKGEKLPGS